MNNNETFSVEELAKQGVAPDNPHNLVLGGMVVLLCVIIVTVPLGLWMWFQLVSAQRINAADVKFNNVTIQARLADKQKAMAAVNTGIQTLLKNPALFQGSVSKAAPAPAKAAPAPTKAAPAPTKVAPAPEKPVMPAPAPRKAVPTTKATAPAKPAPVKAAPASQPAAPNKPAPRAPSNP